MFELFKYLDIGQMEEKDCILSAQEDELIGYYRRLDEKDRKDILEFLKIKGAF